MYNLLLVWLTVVGMAATTYAQQKQDMNSTQLNHKILVAYFSATGTTARAAEKLANVTGGELYAIIPADPYTNADLNWHDKRSRTSVEMNNSQARPAIKNKKENIADYDIIFIGYPIWWDLAPRVINTFIESSNLSNMVIIPFATSGGSSITNSTIDLKTTYPALIWKEGRLLNQASERVIQGWIDELGI